MTNANFRTSNINELFGNSNIGAPSPPGQFDWQSLAITGAFVLIGVVITVSIITHVQKKQMEKIIIHNQTIHEDGIITLTEELSDQRLMIFKLTNLLANDKTETSEKEVVT